MVLLPVEEHHVVDRSTLRVPTRDCSGPTLAVGRDDDPPRRDHLSVRFVDDFVRSVVDPFPRNRPLIRSGFPIDRFLDRMVLPVECRGVLGVHGAMACIDAVKRRRDLISFYLVGDQETYRGKIRRVERRLRQVQFPGARQRLCRLRGCRGLLQCNECDDPDENTDSSTGHRGPPSLVEPWLNVAAETREAAPFSKAGGIVAVEIREGKGLDCGQLPHDPGAARVRTVVG